MSRFAACVILASLVNQLPLAGEVRAQNAESDADRRVQDAISAQAALLDTRPEECRPEGRVPGQIVVCADPERNEKERLPLRDETDTARSTSGGVPPTPDVYGLKRLPGGISISGCFIGPCPPAPMYFFDISALPEAPAGSDADLIAKGEMKAP